MANIVIDQQKRIGDIKPMHGVGQPPILGVSTELFHFLKEANIPYSRLHDVGGWFGGNLWADIPNIFRNFEADENDPASYDFVFTDILIKDLISNGCEPYFRLGVSIENFHKIKSYRIFPPKDMEKWARICEHIIRHYNEGWANGFYYNITYWEIWNEPDNSTLIEENEMWKGTKEEYFQLYRTTSKHLKSCFGEKIKVGGYSSCGFYAIAENTDSKVGAIAMGMPGELNDWEVRSMGFVEFFRDFVELVKKENLPWDFFGYHSYANVQTTLKMQEYVEKTFKENGITNTEIHLNEWNTSPEINLRGTMLACSNATAMLCAMQNTNMQVMTYYDAAVEVSAYGGLFNRETCLPFCTYYGFKAFGELYDLKTQVECTSDTNNVYAVSAFSGGKGAVLVVNNQDKQEDIRLQGINVKELYFVSEDKGLEKASGTNVYSARPYEVMLFVF